MTFTHDKGDGIYRTITCSWVGDAFTGADSGTTDFVVNGELLLAVCTPGTGDDQPLANYDVTIADDKNVDLLNFSTQNLGDLNNAAADVRLLALFRTVRLSCYPVAVSPLTVSVTNAGASNTGTITLHYRTAPDVVGL